MTPEEMFQVLSTAAAYDARLTPPTKADAMVRARAWAAAVPEAMPVDLAMETVVKHYSRTRDQIMPADLNEAYRIRRDRDRAELEAAERASGERGVPMPEHVRQQFQALMARSRA